MGTPADARWQPSRPAVVWAAFLAACLTAFGLLHALAPARPDLTVLRIPAERGLSSHARPERPGIRRVEPRDAPMARHRWKSIVIHDSGAPAGDLASLERRHLDAGLAGLGFHFVIGNGQGIDDGQVVAGFRWDRQLPGAHAAAGWRTPRPVRGAGRPLDAMGLNEESVAVCVVGNLRRRPCTDRQARELAALVRALQAELGIGADAVYLASELFPPSGAPDWQLSADDLRASLLP